MPVRFGWREPSVCSRARLEALSWVSAGVEIPKQAFGGTELTVCSSGQLRHHRHQVASQLLGKEEGSIGAPVLSRQAMACDLCDKIATSLRSR